ncbi:putative polyketide synthase [Astrocystis sublimbata]|nr:putative polyketide synthase [Astrocystis sublimbata]
MSRDPSEPIAIVGSACRFSGGIDSPARLWEILKDPSDLCRMITLDRFNPNGYYHPDSHHGRTSVKHAYLLDQDISRFDAEFFNINPMEAQAMDPQQRLLMEVTFEALENAGVADSLRGTDTAVYVGSMSSDYSTIMARELSHLPTYAATGMATSLLSNRLSYFYDWRGPSITLDTASCGSNLIMSPDNFIVESKLNMLSPEGRCRMWDQQADGYGRGDGIAVLVLKTLRAAIEDGDHVECIIRETILNQDGASSSQGITVPNVRAHESLIRSAYAGAGLNLQDSMDRPQFFEAHGTGTRVGSIKTVLGHTEGTAGIAALMKASLSLQNSIIPPNLLFNQLSDAVAPFYNGLEVPTAAQKWPAYAGSNRRASVNSFGFGGANAHAILESYTHATTVQGDGKAHLFTPYVFSAQSRTSLEGYLGVFRSFLAGRGSGTCSQDLCWTLHKRRSADLINASSEASRIIDNLEAVLNNLPDGPRWSLRAELMMETSQSRVYEAEISQTACTAVQILLVDVIKAAGLHFDVVVGHSSGEIAGAYAAGYLSARDAMCIAYYRGIHLHHALSPNGRSHRGAMMAVGTTAEDLKELLDDPVFFGRVSIAAHNSPSSYTISGDEDAIFNMQTLLNDEDKFNRILQVDKAYHSAHMNPCAPPYAESLRRCGITPKEPSRACVWVSSVTGCPINDQVDLTGRYWAENLTCPVLFTDAIREASKHVTQFDLAIEIGPHPALQNPVSQIFQSEVLSEVPYVGILKREQNSIQTLSKALGIAWERMGSGTVNLDSLDRFLSGRDQHLKLVKDLPTYYWDHRRTYWHESRASRELRSRAQPHHLLLGNVTSDSGTYNMRWTNRLYLTEQQWISDHRVQGQVVFPAAGYLSTALEAANFLCVNMAKTMGLFEMTDFKIHQAMAFDDEDRGIEVLIELTSITVDDACCRIRTAFSYSGVLPSNRDDFILMASGNVTIMTGFTSPNTLPLSKPELPHLVDVETDRFYQCLSDLGYDFSGRFRSLSKLKRRHFKSSCSILMAGAENLMIHPAELDGVLQSCILAYSYPFDGQLRNLFLPSTIGTCRINLGALVGSENASVHQIHSTQRGRNTHAAIQMQRVSFLPELFSSTDWVNDSVDVDSISRAIPLTAKLNDALLVLERVATPDDPIRSQFPMNHYLNYAHHVTTMAEEGKHAVWRPQWLEDTLEDILDITNKFHSMVDIEIMHLVGSEMQRVFQKQTTMLEEFRGISRNNILDRYYANGFGMAESARWISLAVSQIANRYPHMNIIEIGAGTGGATKAILDDINQRFDSYTYTDISAAFFENASSHFSETSRKMSFKVLDVESDPVEQGFLEGTYDLAVAFFVLHATRDIEAALIHIRRLLRPGGFLVVGEGLEGQNQIASSGFIFGTLPGWWLGAGKDGRDLSPHISPKEWDALLRKTGFSGLDFHVPNQWETVLNSHHFVTQAVSDEIQFLRAPLAVSSAWTPPGLEELIIVGGQTCLSQKLIRTIESILPRSPVNHITTVEKLTDIDLKSLHNTSITMLCLTELDKPVFKDMSHDVFETMKSLFGSENRIFWVTSGCFGRQPFCNMTIGFGRVALNENPDLRLQLQNVTELNERYMSKSYTATCLEALSDISIDVQIDTSTDMYYLTDSLPSEKLLSNAMADPVEILELQVSHAMLSAMRTPLGYKFLCLGRQARDGEQFLALCSPGTEQATLVAVTAHLAASQILDRMYRGQILMIQDTPLELCQAFLDEAAMKQVEVIHCHKASTTHCPDNFITYTSDYLTHSDLRELVAHTPDNFVTFSVSEHSSNTATDDAIRAILPTHCHIETKNSMFSMNGSSGSKSITSSILSDILRRSLRHTQRDDHWQRVKCSSSSAPIDVSMISSTPPLQNPLACIVFTHNSLVSVRSTRLDTRPMFKGAHSTYWIVGITRDLGISLCDWMINHGAMNIAISSRKPQISQDWIMTHRKRGVVVSVIPCDVTNESQVIEAYAQISKTLPPVIGVINGAMVLRDVAMRNMTLEDFNYVTKPKVEGSIYLDRLFYRTNLDFFVLVSSINCVVGSSGQANYAAANTFMYGLAAQRRARGFRASVLNAGAIIGAGYMERESRRALDNVVHRLCLTRLSEEDWHQAVAEAINAGRLDSKHGPDVTTGLAKIPFDIPHRPAWSFNPKFSELIITQKEHESESPQSGTIAASIEDGLRGISTPDELEKFIREAFAERLRNILQATMTDDEIMMSRSAHLGVDSLVSVDIRSWFLKSMQVNVPVLKIMGSETMASLAVYAAQHIPHSMVPLLERSLSHENMVDLLVDGETSGSQYADSSKAHQETAHSGIITSDVEPLKLINTLNGVSRAGIDWEAEAIPPTTWADLPPISTNPPSHPPRVLILTGVSGLLGHHLLQYILDHTSIRMIHCLAVRRLSSRLDNGELPTDARVKYHGGNLADHNLGLDDQEANAIFAEADAVIHNGADTSHAKSYHDLKVTNVGSTRAIARLCLPRRIPIHYISSAGVSMYHDKPTFPEVSVASAGKTGLLPSDGTFGYGCSKWVNERFLEHINDSYEVPVYIYRPSTIIREGPDAANSRAQVDWVNALLFYIRKLKCAPQITNNQGALDLVNVRTCCADVLRHLTETRGENHGETSMTPTFINSVGDTVVPLNQLQSIGRGATVTGLLDTLPLVDWIRKALHEGLHPGVALLIEEMDAPGRPAYPKLRRGQDCQ